MKTTEFYKKITSTQLQENIEKQFGSTVNLGKYDREQLEDIRNKLRTRVFQREGSAGINDLLTNEAYQKDKAMLELLNTRIKEMLGENLNQLKNKMKKLSEAVTAVADKKAKKEPAAKKSVAAKPAISAKISPAAKKAAETKTALAAKKAITAKKAVTAKTAATDKKAADKKSQAKKTAKKESADHFRYNVQVVNESIDYFLAEDEEGKAKAITAAGDMVNDFTSWMQRVGQYQTKSMIELADAIRADFGHEESERFKQVVGPALTAAQEVLTAQREVISNAVATLAGESVPGVDMGMEPQGMDMDTEPGLDMLPPDGMNPSAEDEFAASDAASGAGSTGREMRESKFARQISESHSIISKLAQ